MTKKSIWESNFWKSVIALSVILGIIVSILTIPQRLSTIDFWTPLADFFSIPIPLYSIPVTIVGFFIALLFWAKISGNQISSEYHILDNEYARNTANLCRTPQSVDYLKQKHKELHNHNRSWGGYTFEEIMRILESQDWVIFQNGNWQVTQNALNYIAKYHGTEETAIEKSLT